MALLGWDIGGTKCAAVVGEFAQGAASITGKIAFPTCATWQKTVEKLIAASRELLGDAVPSAVGISCGSPLDSVLGVIQSPPNLPGWDDVPIVQIASEEFFAPAYLENDANACALAEWLCGAGRGSRNMVFLTYGTGFGAGLILDGKLYRGTNGNAGEIGHVRIAGFGPSGYGKIGSMEGFCSGGGMAQLAQTVGNSYVQMGKPPLYPVPGASAKDVAMAARQGDKAALEVFAIAGEKLGEGLAILIDILNPERIVIGSIYARCEDLLAQQAEDVIRAEALASTQSVVQIVPAELGESVGDIAALCVGAYGSSLNA